MSLSSYKKVFFDENEEALNKSSSSSNKSNNQPEIGYTALNDFQDTQIKMSSFKKLDNQPDPKQTNDIYEI